MVHRSTRKGAFGDLVRETKRCLMDQSERKRQRLLGSDWFDSKLSLDSRFPNALHYANSPTTSLVLSTLRVRSFPIVAIGRLFVTQREEGIIRIIYTSFDVCAIYKIFNILRIMQDISLNKKYNQINLLLCE